MQNCDYLRGEKMNKIFGFGETVPDYDVPALNEREVWAATGILFFFVLVSFLSSWLMGNFHGPWQCVMAKGGSCTTIANEVS
jgi:hypothetical protein